MRLISSRLAIAGVAILCGIVGICGASGTNPFSRRNAITEIYQNNVSSVVMISVPNPKGGDDIVGTGVIVDERGWIITNWHVVEKHRTPKITLHDGTEVTGNVKFARPHWDLAAIQIQTPKKLRALPLVTTHDLMVGEMVASIGHPYRYRNSLSTGHVSALHRNITPKKDELKDVIQITASINPGNSGGPLFNINGELIGIIVAIHAEAQGIAFAINANTVKEVLRNLLSAEELAQVNHGLVFQEKLLAETGDRQRVIVESFQGACDGDAVLQSGDELRAIGEHNIVNAFDVERALWDYKPGDTVELKVNREGKSLVVALRLGASSGAGSAASAPAAEIQRAVAAPSAKVIGVSR